MADRLYDLVPRVYRRRDIDHGEPMRALLRIIEQQADLLDTDIERLWNAFFIETADAWVVPYIGDLVGTTPLFDSGRIAESEEMTDSFPDLRGPRLVPEVSLRQRADVAKTIYFRRRKGTLAMLEELARDVTGWAAHAVEFFELLAWTQCVRNHLRDHALRTPDLRRIEMLDRLNGAFDEVMHTVDVRPIDTETGWYNIKNIGFFLWRLRAYEAPQVLARQASVPYGRTFSPLGNPAPIFSRWRREGDDAGLATPLHVPQPISHAAIYDDLRRAKEASATPLVTDYYGLFESTTNNPEGLVVAPESSFTVFVDDFPVPPRRLICMNLSTWRQPTGDVVGVDTELGRIALGDTLDAGAEVTVYYHYGFSADIGGGTYDRNAFLIRPTLASNVFTVPTDHADVQTALTAWTNAGRPNSIIRIVDQGTYDLTALPAIDLAAGRWLAIEAASEARPHLMLPDALPITGGDDDSALTFSGLLMEGSLRINGELGELRIVHSTLVPGRHLDSDDGTPMTSDPSIEADPANFNTRLRVTVAFSIVGAIRIPADAERLTIFDSIVDGAGGNAIAAPAPPADEFGPATWIERSTIFGRSYVTALPMATEVIFGGRVRSERTQEGCVRFSWLAPGSKTPKRYRCQPDLEIEQRIEAAKAAAGGGPVNETAIADGVRAWLVPSFTSDLYGQPAYAQLHLRAPEQIRTGAEDGSEMGVFCHLKQPQRESNLRIRLEEYLPFGLEPGLIYVT